MINKQMEMLESIYIQIEDNIGYLANIRKLFCLYANRKVGSSCVTDEWAR